MKKGIKIAGAAVIILAAAAAAGSAALNRAARSVGIGGGDVADYGRRVNIWNTVAGNSSRSKLDDMNIGHNKNALLASVKFIKDIVGAEYKDSEKTIDTYTYLHEIKGGFEKETYEDEPYLIPYPSEGSGQAVIVIPGGGYAFKAMDGGTSEGKDIAVKLNENGISAFVLHYRSNPYEYPVPYLDLQRAVKYLRYHSETYGIDKNKISMIGFSAGGNLIAHYINKIQDQDIYPQGYAKDGADSMDSMVSCVAMVYPAVTFNYNVPMLFSMFPDDDVRNEAEREKLLNLMDNTENFHSKDVRQFVAYGDKDAMVGTEEIPKYIEKAKQQGTDITAIVAEGADHGFGPEYYFDEYIRWLKNQ